MNSGFLSIKRHSFEEKVVYIWSQKLGQGAAVLCRFNRISACQA